MTGSGLLHDKAALVTGGASGLGRAIIARFASEGARGICLDAAAPRDQLPDGWRHFTGDVAVEGDLASAVAEAVSNFGGLDIAVANAGLVPPWSETEAIDMDEWDRVFAVNVRGVVATVKHAVPAMKRAGGSIVAMGSLNSWHAHPRQCLYSATKHAVLGIVRATALDVGRHGIRVNAIGPGPIATEALRSRVERREKEGGTPADVAFAELAEGSAMKRIATENEVAATALYLVSDLSSGVTGTLIPVDCGIA